MVPQPSSAVAGGLPSRPSHASGSTHHEQSKTFSESSRAAEPSAHASNHAGSLPAPASAGQKGLPKPDARTTDASGRRLAAQRAAPNRTRGGRAPAASDGPKGWGHQRPMMATPGHIQQLKDMGFTEEVARQALAACAWDVNRALDMLFTQAASKSSPASGGAADRGQAARSDDVASRTGAEKASAWANLVTPVKPGLGDAANSITGSTVSSPRSSGRTEEWTADFPQLSATGPHPLDAAVPAKESNSIPQQELDSADGALHDESTASQASIADSPVSTDTLVESSTDAASHSASAPNSCEAEPSASAAPAKHLRRAAHTWAAEDNKISVSAGCFLRVWAGSETPHGWIYAEEVADSSRAGWVPTFILHQLPDHHQWMACIKTMEAQHDAQLGVSEGNVLKVSVDTQTKEGWVYAEDEVAVAEGTPSIRAGWVPVCCLQWEV